MKRTFLYLLAIFYSISLLSCSRLYLLENTNSSPANSNIIDSSLVTKDKTINEYTINAELDTEYKTLTGTEKILYVNNENKALDKLYFHLYPNAFRHKDTAPFLFNDFPSAYPQGFSPGYIDINKISVDNDNKNVDYCLSGSGSTILEIKLPELLVPGDNIVVFIDFKIKIPPASERFGVLDNIFNLGNWYPIAAVYDDTGWNLDPYYPIGDPFYSDVSNYSIQITVPKKYVVASSGSLISEEIKGNKKVYKFEETSVRDFALSISDKFVLYENIVDGISVKCYFLRDKNDMALEASVKSLKSFNKLFGKYPNQSYSVVETNFPSGMEYPGLVFIGSKFYKNKSLVNYLETIIVHETAHQWWYGTVGNNEVDEAWLDESLASYSEVIYYYDNYGSAKGKSYYQHDILDYYERNMPRDRLDKSMLKSLSEFTNWDDYGPLVYNKGAIMFHSLRNQLGDDLFFKILKNYYSKFSFDNATTEDFISVVEETTNREWRSFFNKWLIEKK